MATSESTFTDHTGLRHSPQERTATLAESIRQACVEQAIHAYEDAKMRGICHEGAWEVALGAMRSFDLNDVEDIESSGGRV